MRESEKFVLVSGKKYFVQEKPGYIKANLNGIFGWESVWADTSVQLIRRIKRALAGDQ
jgi:hypothetical protein